MNPILKTIKATLIALLIMAPFNHAFANNAVVASGEASEELVDSMINLASASANLSGAGLYLGGSVAIAIGKPIADVVLQSAEVSMDTISFSTEVLLDGIVTTAQLSQELAHAGVEMSTDVAAFVLHAANAGIHMSTETATLFLNQAVNIAVASGRLSGETATLAAALVSAGVDLSIDVTKLTADAAKAGIQISEEAAKNLITACFKISAQCIEATILAERYLLMTLEEANRILYETSLATVAASIRDGQHAYHFSIETARKLKDLGIDSAKYAKELGVRSVKAGVDLTVSAIQGANEATVVVINTGSGLVISTLDSLTAAVEDATKKIEKATP